jgi:NAD(P) transhydrogenase
VVCISAGHVGAHVFGTAATDVGQAMMRCGAGSATWCAVSNYPTLSEVYKVAALDASNKICNTTRIDG